MRMECISCACTFSYKSRELSKTKGLSRDWLIWACRLWLTLHSTYMIQQYSEYSNLHNSAARADWMDKNFKPVSYRTNIRLELVYEVNDTIVTGQVLDKPFAKDYSTWWLILVIFLIIVRLTGFLHWKISFFSKEMSQHPDSLFFKATRKSTSNRFASELVKVWKVWSSHYSWLLESKAAKILSKNCPAPFTLYWVARPTWMRYDIQQINQTRRAE